MRTLLRFCDRTPNALTAQPSSSSRNYETIDNGFKSRQWVDFVMNHYTCSRVIAVYIVYYQYNLYMYDLSMLSLTQVPKDILIGLNNLCKCGLIIYLYKYTADVTDGNPIALWSQSISVVSAVYPLVAFTTSIEERDRCYSVIDSANNDLRENFRMTLRIA
jgi:hypothetical protein